MSLRDIKLKEGERVFRVVQQYGPTLAREWLLGCLIISAAFFFMFWLFGKGVWGQVLFAGLLVVGASILFRTYYLWQRNILIITSHRIIDVEQMGLVKRNISEVMHDQIEDVSGEISGFVPTILKYGDVHVQTGNKKILILAHKVKRPLHIQQMINELKERYVAKYIHDFSGDLTTTILDKLYELETEDLLKIQVAVDKRLRRLAKESED